MSWSDRRHVLGLGLCAALAACGFTPAYGPDGDAGRLQNAVLTESPDTRAGYLLNRRIEERLGRTDAPRYRLAVEVAEDQDDFGTTAAGDTSRYRIMGSARYVLTDARDGTMLIDRTLDSFTGYSATGTNVATLAAERDAQERLMTLLADRIVDRLILAAPDLPR